MPAPANQDADVLIDERIGRPECERADRAAGPAALRDSSASTNSGTLILLIGMDLRHDVALIRLFAGIGGFWLTILLTLSLFDYLTR